LALPLSQSPPENGKWGLTPLFRSAFRVWTGLPPASPSARSSSIQPRHRASVPQDFEGRPTPWADPLAPWLAQNRNPTIRWLQSM